MLARSFAAATALLLSLFATSAKAQHFVPEVLASSPGDRFMIVEFAPGVTDSIYVAERSGLVYRYDGAQFDPTPVLDITDRVGVLVEGGLLGLAFDPLFETNGHVYVVYTDDTDVSGLILSRFTFLPGSTAQADPNSERILFGPLRQATAGHRAGDLEFGPDGMLYMSVGDGNNGDILPLNTAQDVTDPSGSMLRIDVRAPFPHVPAGNPFAGVAGAHPLLWAIGLRNPFRFDVDEATGDLYVCDVGAGTFEEVNRLPQIEPGLNFGWRCREGTQCTSAPNCACPSPDLRDPIATLMHDSGPFICAVVGGVFVRGGVFPSLDGSYVFADYCSGGLYAVMDPAGTPSLVDLSAGFRSSSDQPIRYVVDLEQAPDGDIYFVTQSPARLWRLDSGAGFDTYCSAAPNSTGSAASIVASGSPSIGDGDLTLEVDQLPANSVGLFLMSQSAGQLPLGGGSQGSLCIGQPLFRWRLQSADSGALGRVEQRTDYTNLPPMVDIQPGDTWYFQYWTRDANPNPTSNTSNGAVVRFTL